MILCNLSVCVRCNFGELVGKNIESLKTIRDLAQLKGDI